MERHKWLMVKCVIVFRTIRRGMTAGEQRNLATKKYIDQEIQTCGSSGKIKMVIIEVTHDFPISSSVYY